MKAREYPDAVAGPFPEPPETMTDREGREIDIRESGDGPVDDPDEERAALVEMYAAFDAADRAQGIPPTGQERIERWLDTLLGEKSVNVVAWHGDAVCGHATLVPDDEGASELAIFVLQAYQRAGIGSRLIRCLLGAGAAAGVDRVWLTVEHWNTPAIELYRDVGFETTDTESFERIMTLRLAPDE